MRWLRRSSRSLGPFYPLVHGKRSCWHSTTTMQDDASKSRLQHWTGTTRSKPWHPTPNKRTRFHLDRTGEITQQHTETSGSGKIQRCRSTLLLRCRAPPGGSLGSHQLLYTGWACVYIGQEEDRPSSRQSI